IKGDMNAKLEWKRLCIKYVSYNLVCYPCTVYFISSSIVHKRVAYIIIVSCIVKNTVSELEIPFIINYIVLVCISNKKSYTVKITEITSCKFIKESKINIGSPR